jgi:uncharacterized protein YecE (DUF72 family)
VLRIGCAGWSIPRSATPHFPSTGTHLERYAKRLAAVEINSSFYRPHRRATYERWAAAVPEDFSFSAKVPRELTHDARLTDPAGLDAFLDQVAGLGRKLGAVLVQLPPSLAFDFRVARRFFSALRARHGGAVACEPRHPSWFVESATSLLTEQKIARVAADPACVPAAAAPGGWPGFVYYRLHGSPRTYWSAYEAEYLATLAPRLSARANAVETWCVFDNTAAGVAVDNALDLTRIARES